MNAISMVQSAMITKLKSIFGNAVRAIDVLPGIWDETTIKRIMTVTPAIYVSWQGSKTGRVEDEIIYDWTIWAVAQVLNGVRTNEITTYDILEHIQRQFNREFLKNDAGNIGGPLLYQSTQNLWTDTKSSAGISIFAINFKQGMAAAPPLEQCDCGEFISMFTQFTDGIDNKNILIESEIWPRNPQGLP